MNFSEALKLLKEGKKVGRNGSFVMMKQGIYAYQPGVVHPSHINGVSLDHFAINTEGVEQMPTVVWADDEGPLDDFPSSGVPDFLAENILADDWELAE